MIRILKEHIWVEATAGIGSLTGAVVVGDKVYVPRVRERLQWHRTQIVGDAARTGWYDVPTVETPLPPPPNA